ncbi:NDR1/HIN1-like protein 6 [Aristolochia californica]|uniref:NDR1/HIN1-like protein 6 n=1 Tax=Aristolochia californica TaxID=171875 RepID=UPI0035E287B0
MANSAAPDPIPPLPKPPGHDQRTKPTPPPNHQRCVSFSEPIKPTHRPPPRKRSGCLTCCICCAWTILVFLILLLLLLLTGTIFYMWAQPESPEFHIERLTITNLDLTQKSELTYLTSRIDIFVAAANRNDKIGFQYGPTKVFLSTSKDMVNLGRATIPSFEQGPNNLTIVKVPAGVTNSLVPSADGQRLMEKFRRNEVVVSAELKGSVRMVMGGWHSESFDIRVECKDIATSGSKKASGINPRCEILLLGWIPLRQMS